MALAKQTSRQTSRDLAYGSNGYGTAQHLIGTPPAIVQRLNQEIVAIANTDDFRARMIAAGADPMTSTPQAFAERIDAETKKFARLVKEHGITVN